MHLFLDLRRTTPKHRSKSWTSLCWAMPLMVFARLLEDATPSAWFVISTLQRWSPRPSNYATTTRSTESLSFGQAPRTNQSHVWFRVRSMCELLPSLQWTSLSKPNFRWFAWWISRTTKRYLTWKFNGAKNLIPWIPWIDGLMDWCIDWLVGWLLGRLTDSLIDGLYSRLRGPLNDWICG